MKSSTRKSPVRRILAAGLGLTLMGGMSLVAVAPAQADAYRAAMNIDPSTIPANGETNEAGWYSTAGSGESSPFTGTRKGLELHGQSAVGQSFAPGESLDASTLLSQIVAGGLGWATAGGPAVDMRIVIDARSVESGQEPRTVTLTPVESVPGTNIVQATDQWTADASIARDDNDTDADFQAGEPAPLADFLSADGVNSISGFALAGTTPGQSSVVGSATWPTTSYGTVYVNDYTFLAPLKAGTVKVRGKAAIGQTLTAEVSGWPEGAKLSYEWVRGQEYSGGPIEGATAKTYKITDEDAFRMISVSVTGSLEGYADSRVLSDRTPLVPAPAKSIAPAPAADSDKLASFLKDKGVQKQKPTAVGLPAGKLDATKEHTADVVWTALDSHVDVYLYSTPTKVGSFPVVDGKAQITLTSEVLSTLEGGSHTLVITGQTSGEVQAVALEIEPAPAAAPDTATVEPAAVEGPQLADTGSALTFPVTAGVILLLAGAALFLTRRRMAQHS
ncbi:LPXTG cell wall anchor domain-containing protein [Arthrobacter sp.]|uniref:LPXTG cell wall anchor domain-containing protein n=1 Tax=Arthrobacter sp. TaxID=1667 RepID=UPI003396BD82